MSLFWLSLVLKNLIRYSFWHYPILRRRDYCSPPPCLSSLYCNYSQYHSSSALLIATTVVRPAVLGRQQWCVLWAAGFFGCVAASLLLAAPLRTPPPAPATHHKLGGGGWWLRRCGRGCCALLWCFRSSCWRALAGGAFLGWLPVWTTTTPTAPRARPAATQYQHRQPAL